MLRHALGPVGGLPDRHLDDLAHVEPGDVASRLAEGPPEEGEPFREILDDVEQGPDAEEGEGEAGAKDLH